MSESAPTRLWTAVWLPPVVWGIQGLFGWFAASHACPGTSQPWSLTTARWMIGAVTVVALGVSLWALGVSRRIRDGSETTGYLSFVALVVGGTLALGLVFGILPEIWIGFCGEMR